MSRARARPPTARRAAPSCWSPGCRAPRAAPRSPAPSRTCAFCSQDAADRALLELFLLSRGNLKEVERALGVSYPTARHGWTR